MTGPRPSGTRVSRVWILNHYANTPDRPAGTRHHALARELVKRGMDVTIFAAGFNHGSRREERLRGAGLVRNEAFEGVRYAWLRTIPYPGNGVRRMANMASYSLLAPLAQLGRPAPDVVVGSSVHPFAALAGWLIARLRGARFIYEVRDLWPQTLIDLGALRPGSAGARGLAAIEAFLVRRAETVVTVLPAMGRYLDERGLPSGHVQHLPNGVDLDAADRPHPRADEAGDPLARLLDDLDGRGERDEIVFAWLGSFGRVNRLDIVIRALQIAACRSPRRLRLLLVGDGPERASLERLVAEGPIPGVQIVDPVAKARVPDLLARVDVGVLHYTATPVYRYGVSFNKLSDYMAARLPIVFACSTWGDPVAAAGAGPTVPPDDPEALATAFVTLAGAPAAERARLGAAGRAFVERELDIARIGDRFARIVEGSADGPAPLGEPARIGPDAPLPRAQVVWQSRVKRAVDLSLATAALLALSPLLAVIAVAIRVTMGSPVLFRQKRPGWRGEPFEIVKFRSMRTAFGPDGRPLPVRERLTKLGWFLRRTSLDEVPELWNVVKGEMSLVGPRPLLMEYLPRYSAEQAHRHDVKPGLTGLAQVSGRHLLGWDDRFRLDVRYIESWSLRLDLRILRSTVLQVLTGRGLPVQTASDDEFQGSPAVRVPAGAARVRLRTALLSTDDPGWRDRLGSARHDVYHLPEYLRFATDWQEPGEPVMFVAEEPGARLLVPLILRPIPPALGADGLIDAVSPRGYPGPLLALDRTPDATDFVGRAADALVDGLRERGVVSAFARLHPLLTPPLEGLCRIGTVMPQGDSVSVDLSRSPDDLWLDTRQNHRRDIRQAIRAGYTVRIDEDWSCADAFADAYRQSMERLGADPFWRLTPGYFEALRASLGPHVHLCVAEVDGEFAAGALFTEVDGLAEYHLAGTADAHVAASPSKLIIDFGRRWARARGNRVFHLAGSVRPGDGLIRFKLGFSPRRHTVSSWRIVVDPPAYERLSRCAAAPSPGAEPDTSFFPAYRRPVNVPA